MNFDKLSFYWDDIPIGKDNAADYTTLIALWGGTERTVRILLHELSRFDNGDNYVLIRSSTGKGFYRTDDTKTIQAYRKECLNKGKSIFAPFKKIDRILTANTAQLNFENNLRVVREEKHLSQGEVCKKMKQYDKQFDKLLLSKMENNICLPTPYQLARLSEIYGIDAETLVDNQYTIFL